MSSKIESTDVIIVGGGPVGLTLAYALQRMKVSTYVVERQDKESMPMYGRACTLWTRTLELLDQLGLLTDILQIGFVARNSANFDRDGKRVNSRGWQLLMSQIHGTYLDYFVNIRLKQSEHILQKAYEELGGEVAISWELDSFKHDTTSNDPYPVRATIHAVNSKEVKVIRGKYLVGADGTSSIVRQLSGIAMPRENSSNKWVRIDGVVKTDLPSDRIGAASIESPTHGNILIVHMDKGRTRIGFALSPALHAKYGDHITQDQAMEEAIASVRPFKLEFVTVDWYTMYSVKQGVAKNYVTNERIMLVGDACHTHSSGAAQGMNTGVHDAINLAWKLGGILRGWYKPAILETYDSERRPVAQELIRIDKEFATLISGNIPNGHEGTATPETLLSDAMRNSASFYLGLGISYNGNMINVPPSNGVLASGVRPPDSLLYRPGADVPIRLQQLTMNYGNFWVLVFTGSLEYTRSKLCLLRRHIDEGTSIMNRLPKNAIKFLTIIEGMRSQGEEALGIQPFGRFYFDPVGEALERFGFVNSDGGIAILRPDGHLGFATYLDGGEMLDGYFERFCNV